MTLEHEGLCAVPTPCSAPGFDVPGLAVVAGNPLDNTAGSMRSVGVEGAGLGRILKVTLQALQA